MNRPVNKDAHRINERITVSQVRLIDAEGINVGVVETDDAMGRARRAGLDLVEISPTVDPPVCKIMDYGKFKYVEAKKRNEARKNQKTIELKEIKLRPSIEKHDFDVKLSATRKFLDHGDKVKLTIRFRGREMAHSEFGMELLERLKEECKDIAKVDQSPTMDGRQLMMILTPIGSVK